MGSRNIPGTIRCDAYAAETPNIIKVLPGFNARSELKNIPALKASIKQRGVRDALWVRPDYADQEHPFILIDGERRLTALRELYQEAQDAGVEWDIKIQLQIFHCDEAQAEELMALALLERDNPSFGDEADLVSRWVDRGFTVLEISTKLNRCDTWVEQRRTFSLLNPEVKRAVRDDKISVQAALDMARKIPQGKQTEVLTKVLAQAGAKKNTRKVVAECTGTPVRPGKRELVKVLAKVDGRQVNGSHLSLREAKRLVLTTLRYCCGELASEQYLAQCYSMLREEPPAHVINHMEL